MNLKQRFVVLVVGFMSVLAMASEPVTVKVFSKLCNSNAAEFAGSGMAFQYLGQNYVLTSEHVVYHDRTDRFCHSVQRPGQGKVSAVLLGADWGQGVALLKLPAGTYKNAPQWGTLKDQAAAGLNSGDSIMISGVPRLTTQELTDSGSIVDPMASRFEIPLLSSMILLKDVFGEYGMSGGPVYLAGSQKNWIGILSHQFLALVPGAPSRVGEFDSASQFRSENLLVIPAKALIEWTDSVLMAQNVFVPSFVRDPDEQALGEFAVYSQGLRFSGKTLEESTTPVGGGDAHGIGGGDAHGIGGGDAHGIGGGDAHGIGGGDAHGIGGDTGQDYIGVAIERDTKNHNASISLGKQNAFGIKIQNYLTLGMKPRVVGFLSKSSSGPLAVQHLSSVSEAVSQLYKNELTPVVLNASKATQNSVIQSLGTRLLVSSQAMARDGLSLDAQALLSDLETFAQIAASDAYMTASPNQVSDFLETRNAAWGDLMEGARFESAVQIMNLLNQIKTELANTKL